MTHRRQNRPRRGPGLGADDPRRIGEGEFVPTSQEVERLGELYELSEIERRFLHLLAAGEVNDPVPVPPLVPSEQDRRRVDAQWPYPAAVLDHRWNILYSNPAYRLVLRGITARGDNFLDWMFLDDNARTVVVDFATEARWLVGRFRFACAAHPNDPGLAELLQRCHTDPLFAAAWDDPTVLADGPAATAMHWSHRDSDLTLPVTEIPLPGSDWLTLQLAGPGPGPLPPPTGGA
jgi:hypothetical protein